MGRKHRRERNHGSSDNYSDVWGVYDEDQSFSKSQVLKIKPFKAKTDAQKEAYEITKSNVLTFLGGPAGCGKTIVLCAIALEFLAKNLVKKIVITRPALEAKGEKLGFMPGDERQKLGHYLVPLYDNFEIFIGQERLQQLLDEKVIEIVPIAHARGRTFNDAFLIIDEGQNLTHEQMYLILTRIGFGSYAGMTFDESQIDLPRRESSCVLDIQKFRGYDSIGYFEFSEDDIVRSEISKLVVKILSKNKEE